MKNTLINLLNLAVAHVYHGLIFSVIRFSDVNPVKCSLLVSILTMPLTTNAK